MGKYGKLKHNIYSAIPTQRFEQMFDRPDNRYLLECVIQAATEVLYATLKSFVDDVQQ